MDGQQLRAAREALGLTQTQLAKRLGVGLRTLQEWEDGDRAIRPMVELAREGACSADHLGAAKASTQAHTMMTRGGAHDKQTRKS